MLGHAIALGAALACTAVAMVGVILMRESPALAKLPFAPALPWAAGAVVFAGGAACAWLVLRHGPALLERLDGRNPLPQLRLAWCSGSILAAAAVLAVLWIPWAVVQYPGGINYDTYESFYQFTTPAPTFYGTLSVYYNAEFIDHHPVFDSLVYGLFFWAGNAAGSQNLGVFAFIVVQLCGTAIALAASCCYLERLRVPKLLRLAALAFFAFVPIVPLWASTMMKDSLYAMLFVAFFICYLEAFRTRGNALRDKRWLVGLVVFGCLAILTKKTAPAIVVPSLALLALYCRDARPQVAAAALAVPIVSMALVPALLFPALGGVQPGGTQEGVGFALQQVTTVAIEAGDLTEAEIADISRVIDLEQAKQHYTPTCVDPVKNKVYPYATTEDYLAFARAYLSIGLRHPLLYLESILHIAGGFLCPGATMQYYRFVPTSSNFPNEYLQGLANAGYELALHQPSPIAEMQQAYSDFHESVHGNPVLRIVLGRGLYAGWIPISCAILSACCARRYWVACAPALLAMATLLVCPVVSTRYMLALLYGVALMLGVLCHALRTSTSAQGTTQQTQLQHSHK